MERNRVSRDPRRGCCLLRRPSPSVLRAILGRGENRLRCCRNRRSGIEVSAEAKCNDARKDFQSVPGNQRRYELWNGPPYHEREGTDESKLSFLWMHPPRTVFPNSFTRSSDTATSRKLVLQPGSAGSVVCACCRGNKPPGSTRTQPICAGILSTSER